jgi:hypothetical protein
MTEAQAITVKHQIVSRWNPATVLFECDLPEDLASGMATRYALERAVQARAVLRDAVLSGADLSGADLRGADLRDAVLSGADLSGADLRDAVLSGAVLSDQKNDFFDVLLRAPREVAGLRAALIAGRVDGSTYEGECACLVGTIAHVRGGQYNALGNGLAPNSSRPIERFFMSIRKGDTPETSQASAVVVGWLDEFVALLAAAQTPQAAAAAE